MLWTLPFSAIITFLPFVSNFYPLIEFMALSRGEIGCQTVCIQLFNGASGLTHGYSVIPDYAKMMYVHWRLDAWFCTKYNQMLCPRTHAS